MVQGAALIIAGCTINNIPLIQWVHPRAKDVVSIILSILSLLSCWFGFSLIFGPSLNQYGWQQPMLFVTGLALLGWSIRMIIRGFQTIKTLPVIAGVIGIIPAMLLIQLGSPVIAEGWISLAYGFAALLAAKGIYHFVQLYRGYLKTKQIYILHIVYGLAWIGIAVTGAGYATTQTEMYLNIAATLMAIGFGYFLFLKGYQLYQDFKNQPELTEEERKQIRQEIFNKCGTKN
ncbi:hypothetical protein [Desmospora activa]|uniref:Uncharacterized protein n=1 Tax=Desmospora activa DSM 45169 TaxID=1121389 RepID=A0A2T4YYY4_9BACL|nr:hypothetical protein [Desmospora activa]PTM52201.1 hypothetical protein C8J48_3748 [Desmospora activa DSM 45169]